MKTLFYLLGISLCLFSCSQKYLAPNSRIYSFSEGDGSGEREASSKVYITKERTPVQISDYDSYLIITSDTTERCTAKPIETTDSINFGRERQPNWKIESEGRYYFNEPKDEAENASNTLKYYSIKGVLQTASVPVKIRPAIRSGTLGDSIPSTTETGFNIGFMYGCKFTKNIFEGKPNSLGQTSRRHSLTPGVFASLGAADLSKAATRPAIEFPRKTPMLSVGGTIVYGFNSINLGYAFGWDHALGRHSETWLYQGRIWHGIIVSLDLIK